MDFGYDVSDYEKIDPMYGTMEDFDRLVKMAKQHGIRIILDFVVNHTSDQHPMVSGFAFFAQRGEAQLVYLAGWQRTADRRIIGLRNLGDRLGSWTARPEQ